MQDIAQKLVETILEQRAQRWMKELDGIARQIEVSPVELRKFCKPLLQKILDKHLSN